MNIIKRTYHLGDEWLYYKIYCGVRTADSILANQISKVIEELLNKKIIAKWFFIRYADPEKHIRIRFKLIKPSRLFEVVSILNLSLKPLLEEELIWKVQTETYSRELERYGITTMELSETLFFKQSQSIIQLLQGNLDEETYFIKVLILVNDFISYFNLKDANRVAFLEENAAAYSNEFKIDKQAKHDIKKKYQKLKPLFEKELMNTGEQNSKIFVNEIRQITRLFQKGSQDVTLENFISSHIHMLVNRAFRDKQRFYELLIYSFLINSLKSNIYA